MAARQADYKNTGKGMESLRAKRVEVTVELRKARRDSQLCKRRNLVDLKVDEMDDQFDGYIQPEASSPESASWEPEQLELLTQKLASADTTSVWEAVFTVRKMLSQECNPPIDLVLDGGFLPCLVDFLSESYSPQLQFEAAWALTNIASGNSLQTKKLIEAGVIPKLVNLLKSPVPNVVEQSVWALGNIAGDGPQSRDIILQANCMPALLKLVNHEMPYTFLRTVTWALSNMCRNKNPPPPFELVCICLPALHNMLSVPDCEVLSNALWALSYMTDGPNQKIQVVVDAGVSRQLVELLSVPHSLVVTPALRAVGNIVTGNEAQTDAIVKEGALPILGKLMQHETPNIVREATWAVSNILAGSTNQIQAVITSGILEPLLRVLSRADFKAMREAAWAVTNLISGGTTAQIAVLIHMNFVPPMCYLVDCLEMKMSLTLIEGLCSILKCATKINAVNKVVTQIEESGGLDKIEALQQHSNPEIYDKASNIIESYFSDESEMIHIASEINPFLAMNDLCTQNLPRFEF